MTTRAVPVSEDAPRRYAALSGDNSPVHLSDTEAQRVGLPGVILHGLYSMGLAAAAVADETSADPRRWSSMTVRFRSPIFPAQDLVVELQANSGRSIGFAATQADRPVLSHGSVRLRRLTS